jgi:hypothetical protein
LVLRLEGLGRFVRPLHTLTEPAHDFDVVSQRNSRIGTRIIDFVVTALQKIGTCVLQQGLKLEALGLSVLIVNFVMVRSPLQNRLD